MIKEKVIPLDFKGEVEIRENTNNSLISYLKSKGFDTERYEPIGASFTTCNVGNAKDSSLNYSFEGSFICIDKKKSEDGKEHLVSIRLKELVPNDFFSLFHMLDVSFLKNEPKYNTKQIIHAYSIE